MSICKNPEKLYGDSVFRGANIQLFCIFVPDKTKNVMNLRDIKKDIDYILSAFIEDCSVVAAVNSKVSEEKATALCEEAVEVLPSSITAMA